MKSKPSPIKPPLGVCPKQIWIDQRKRNLARAVHEYIEFGIYDEPTTL